MDTTQKSKAKTATPSSAPTAKPRTPRKMNGTEVPKSEEFKQDRVTLIAFYALFAAIAAGLLYFLSLIFFI